MDRKQLEKLLADLELGEIRIENLTDAELSNMIRDLENSDIILVGPVEMVERGREDLHQILNYYGAW